MRLFSPSMYRSGRLDCKQTATSLLRASPADPRYTAVVKRSKDKRYHLSALVVPEGTDISLAGKDIVL